jgi:hypothetical protein
MSIPTNEIVKFLTAVIEDVTRTAEEKERAATALTFYADKIGEEVKPSGSAKRDEVERHVAEVFGRMGATMLWETPEDCMFQTSTGADGITRRHVLSKKYHSHTPASLKLAR